MNERVFFARICLFGTAAAMLSSCAFRPTILSARSYSSADNEIVEIRLRSDDARTLKNKQIYFSLVVIECDGGKARFPMEPYIFGQRATEFKFPIAEKYVVVTGSMPAKNYALYHRPCALIEGSGYSLTRVASPPIPVAASMCSNASSSCADLSDAQSVVAETAKNYIFRVYPDFKANDLCLQVTDSEDKWEVTYQFPSNMIGGSPVVLLDKQTGIVLRSYRTQ